MTANHYILLAEDLSIGYGSAAAKNFIAEGLDFKLEAGKLIALIGANGIGKSTLLRTISGLQKPLAGQLLLQGKKIQDYGPLEWAQNLSLVLTESLPPSNLTIYELVALGRQPYTNWIGKLSDEDYGKIDQAIQHTGIADFAGKKHDQVSDGQLQRALIARALAQDTPLIVLDEPTTHLDLLHKASLFKLLKSLCANTGKCILFSTHDLDLALQLSDQLMVMTEQRIRQGTAQELMAEGVFSDLFKGSEVWFDSQSGRFRVKD